MSTPYDAIVQRGVAFLDSVEPTWRDCVDPPSLHLGHCASCVLGQVYGSFENALWELDLSYDEAKEYGFMLDDDEWDATPARYAWLTRAWRKVLS